jgi:hypothetical protein
MITDLIDDSEQFFADGNLAEEVLHILSGKIEHDDYRSLAHAELPPQYQSRVGEVPKGMLPRGSRRKWGANSLLAGLHC